MKTGFTARGTTGGNVTVSYDGGREVAVTSSTPSGIDTLIAEAYRQKYPAGEVSARGIITTTVEMD